MLIEEMHELDHVQIYSDEPKRGSFSCFDYSHEGDDKDKDEEDPEYDDRFRWDDCKLTFDDDGLYWKSKKGKNAALTAYAVKKAELKPYQITLWVAPTDSSDQMAVVDFYTDKKRDPLHN